MFQLQSNGVDCGSYCAGQAQELITNRVAYGVPQDGDTQWTPAAGASSTIFYQGLGRINDYKTTLNNQFFQDWPFQNTYFSRTQNIRMLFTDFCGNQRIYSCGSVNLGNQKIDDQTWQILQQ